MNAEAQKRALAVSRKAASSVFADVEDDEDILIAAEAAPAQGDVRRVEYSEMAEIGFPAQSRDRRNSPKEQQHRLDKFRLARGQSDFRLPPPKCS